MRVRIDAERPLSTLCGLKRNRWGKGSLGRTIRNPDTSSAPLLWVADLARFTATALGPQYLGHPDRLLYFVDANPPFLRLSTLVRRLCFAPKADIERPAPIKERAALLVEANTGMRLRPYPRSNVIQTRSRAAPLHRALLGIHLFKFLRDSQQQCRFRLAEVSQRFAATVLRLFEQIDMFHGSQLTGGTLIRC